MHTLDTLISSLHAHVPEMIALTRRLVDVNSYSNNVAGVNRVALLLEQAFQLPGLTLDKKAGGAGSGDHLFWSTSANGTHPATLLIGHHDTVFPPGHFEGFREDDGRGFGPGCLDMKGGLALVWGVISTLSAADMLKDIPIILASVGDEEVGSLDSKPHLETLAKQAAGALVFESGRTGDAIITRRRGVGNVTVHAAGRAAHAGNNHREGANALWALARYVELAQSLTDYDQGTTVNVGLMHGGTSPNTVPAAAEATLDLRFTTVADAERLLQRLHDGASQVALPNTTLQLTGGIKRLPMEKSDASAALYEAYARCQAQAGLGRGEHPLVGGGSDANTVAGVGLAAIDGLGLRGAGFHTKDEYIELDSFGPKAEALLRYLYTTRRA